MTYRFIQDLGGGINRYEFTLVVYRDCDATQAAGLDNPAHIGVYRGSLTSAVFDSKIDVPIGSLENVQPVIPPCADASQVSNACVQRGIYVFTLDLPVLNNQSYIVVYQRCCRTDQIGNIVTPDAFGGTYMVELTPAAQATGNSSPTFLNYPPTFICNNLPLNFDHSATDIDGDSLAYEFYTPLDGGGQGGGGGGGGCNSPQPNPSCGPPFDQVVFTSLYSQAAPMGGNPVIAINPVSGLLTGTPHMLGQYVVGIRVKEYRNGVLIGFVNRDFQFNVVDCTSTVVANLVATQVTGPKQFLVERCGEKVVTIFNQSPLSPDLDEWEWEVDFGNGNLFTTGTWNLTVALPDFGEYQGRLYLNRTGNCKDTAFFTLKAFPGVVADFADTWEVCMETPVAFSDSSVSGATGGVVSWAWTFNSPGSPVPPSNLQNPVVSFPVYGSYLVKLVVTDSDGCKDEIQRTVVWKPELPPVIPELPHFRICLPGVADFPLLDTVDVGNSHIVWDFGDGKFANDIVHPTHIYKPGTYTVSVALTTPFNCFSTDTFINVVDVVSSPVAGFSYLPGMPSNLDNTVLFTDHSDSTVVLWSWQFGNFGTSHQQNPLFSFPDTGLIPIVLTVTNAAGCPDTTLKVIDLVPKVQLYIPNAFAPQSDSGLGNERFGMLGILPGYTNYRMGIYSRWGELLFESTNPSEGWDGRRAGNKGVMPKGVYVYSIRFTGPRGEPFRFDGTVSLL